MEEAVARQGRRGGDGGDGGDDGMGRENAGEGDGKTQAQEGREAAHGLQELGSVGLMGWVERKRGGMVFLCSVFKPVSTYFYNRSPLIGNNVLFSSVRRESFFVGRLPDDWASSRESIRRKALRFSVLPNLAGYACYVFPTLGLLAQRKPQTVFIRVSKEMRVPLFEDVFDNIFGVRAVLKLLLPTL